MVFRLPHLSLTGLAVALLVVSAFAPADWSVLTALVVIIVLGIPHGALDGEVARDILRLRFGLFWFAIFALPYLALSALVLTAWHLFPIFTLAGFLGASAWHFGSEETEDGSLLEHLVCGGLPIAVPTLAHPAATASVFAAMTQEPMDRPPLWLSVMALVWVALTIAWCVRIVGAGHPSAMARSALLVCCFLALPPLTAFAIYFVGVHAPAHTRALIADRGRALRVSDPNSAAWRALPWWIMTVALGVALWPIYGGAIPTHLMTLTLQGLAALTLPHMLLEAHADRLRSIRSLQLKKYCAS